MAEFREKLGSRKERAILALLTSRSVEEAARTANVPPRTLYRWMKEPAFDAEYRAARRAAYGQAIARLQQATSAAATTLMKTMVEASTSASVKVRAAEAIFNHAFKGIELEDVVPRIASLERVNEASKQTR